MTSTNKTTRDTNFAQTFRGLGHLMHLVQDMSVPEHTRDDGHYAPAYEEYVRDHSNLLTTATINPIFFDMTALVQPSAFTNAPVPISNLFDTNQYTGYNPDITVNNNIGLAEYTNANFVSPDTLFKNFTYPSKNTSVEVKYYDIPDLLNKGTTVKRPYYRKKADGETGFDMDNDGIPDGYRLTGEDYFAFYRQKVYGGDVLVVPPMDDNVYADYAAFLLPRAVGYSAGLLNYFFRGQMEVTILDGGIKVKNTNTEEMSSIISSDIRSGTTTISGGIYIYYDYIDPKSGEAMRRFLTSHTLSIPLAPGDETELISFPFFTPPNDNIVPGRYIVVFYGRLGNEDGAVIGKVTSPTKIYIYYVSKRGGFDKIYRMDIDGANQTVVYDNQQPDTQIQIGKLAVSSDGTKLAYTIATPNPPYYNIYLLDLTIPVSGSNPTFLTQGNWPSWSHDGTKIAFERDLGSSTTADIELFTIDITKGIETQLTNIPASSAASRAAWSPDSNSIAYSRREDGVTECNSFIYPIIYLMDSSGNPIGPVTCSFKESDRFRFGSYPWNPYGIDGVPSWNPSGTEITFTRKRIDGYDQDTG